MRGKHFVRRTLGDRVRKGTAWLAFVGLTAGSLVVVPLLVDPAAAGTRFTNEELFLGALGDGATSEGFDGFTDGQEINTQVPGVTFSSPGQPLHAFASTSSVSPPNVLFGGFPTGVDDRQRLHATFDPPARGVGFWLTAQHPDSTPVTIEVQTSGGAESFSLPDTDNNENTPQYFGYVASAGDAVTELRVISGLENTGGFEEIALDDFAFASVQRTAESAGRLAFTRSVAGNADIYTMGEDGSGVTRLTTHSAIDSDPSYSLAAGKIAFVSRRDGNFEIYTMNRDGSGKLNVTNNAAFDADPVISPDGTKIAFSSNRAPGNQFDIWVMNLDGTGLVNVTNHPAWDSFAGWTPDSRLLFQSNRSGNFDIWTSAATAVAIATPLTTAAEPDEVPQASPDGTQIAWTRTVAGQPQIWVMDSDGTDQRQVPVLPGNNSSNATWSPDSQLLAFDSHALPAEPDIYVARTDGSGLVNLTNGGSNGGPSWVSPLTLTVDKSSVNASPTHVPVGNIPFQHNSAKIAAAPYNDLPQLVPYNDLPQLVPYNPLPQLVPYNPLPQLVPYNDLPQLVPYNDLPQLVPYNPLPQLVPYNDLPQLVPAALENLKKVPFSSIVITAPGGHAAIIAGTPLATRQLQDISVFDVLSNATSRDRFIALPNHLTSLGLSAIRDLSLGFVLLGKTTLADIDSPAVDWCAALEGLEFGTPCGASVGGLQATPLGLQIAGVPFNDNDFPINLYRVRMGDISLHADAQLRNASMTGADFLETTNFGAILISALPAGSRSAFAPSCAPDMTLHQAKSAGCLIDGLKYTHLGSAVDDFTVAEVVYGLAGFNVNPYEDLSLDQLGVLSYADPARTSKMRYTANYFTDGSAAQLSINLPRSFVPIASSATLRVGGTELAAVPTVTRNDDGAVVSWTLPASSPGDKAVAAVDVRPGVVLGRFAAAARVLTSTDDLRASASAPVTVNQNFEPNDSVAGAIEIMPNELYIGHAPDGDDFYKLATPAPGSIVEVSLGNRNGGDTDLVVYHPTGASGVSNADRLRNATGDPSQILPVSDNGAGQNRAGEPLSAETREDLSIADLPVAGISDNRSRANEVVRFVALPSPAGSSYTIQVSPYLADRTAGPHTLRVQVRPPRPALPCPARSGAQFASWAQATEPLPASPLAAGVKTIFLVNRDRMVDLHGATAVDSMMTDLRTLAGHAKVNGVIVPVDRSVAVQQAYSNATTGWDANPCDPARSNRIVRAINDLVDSLRSGSQAQIENIVVVGSEEAIPRALVPDASQTGNEALFNENELGLQFGGQGNSLTGGGSNIRSDDPYGDFDPVPYFGRFLYTADVAVGRLLETPDQIRASLGQFIATNGRLGRSTAFTAGGYFMKDLTTAIDKAMEANTGAAQPERADDGWNRQTVIDNFTAPATSPNFVNLHTHANQSALGPPTNPETAFRSTDIVAAGAKLAGTVFFTIGCHSGLSVADVLVGGLAGSTDDFAQAMSGTGGLMLGQTGYGLGLESNIAWSEKLMLGVARNLNGSVTIGRAVTKAKQAYLADGVYSPYDEKAVLEANLAGLPMYEVGVPITAPAPQSAAQPSGTDPATGLQTASLSVTTNLRKVTTPLGSYYENGGDPLVAGTGETHEVHDRPVQAGIDLDVTLPNLTAKGSWITARTELAPDVNVDAVFAAPAISGAGASPKEPQPGEVVYPAAPHRLTRSQGPGGSRQHVSFVPTQFEATGVVDGKTVGRVRKDSEYEATVFYTPPGNTDFVAPQILSAGAVKLGQTVTFLIEARDPSPPEGVVKRVSVLFRDTSGWHFAELVQSTSNPLLWTGGGTFTGPDVEFGVQAVDAAGNVGSSWNKGIYFDATVLETPPAGISARVIGSTPTNGWYGTGAKAELTGGTGVQFDVSVDGGDYQQYKSPLPIDGDGVHSVAWRASTGALGVLVVPIDTQVPEIIIVSPRDGASYTAAERVLAEFRCLDESGIDECTGTVPNGSTVNTGAGSHTFTVNARDLSGRTATKSVTYSGKYVFEGFFSPIENPNVLNGVTAGRNIPVKWRLRDANGFVRLVTVVTVHKSDRIDCGDRKVVNNTELGIPIDTLHYDILDEQFVFGWRTDKGWKDTCRQLSIGFDDGQVRTALFKFS